MTPVVVARRGERFDTAEFRPGYMADINAALNAIAAEVDEPTEVCS